MRIYGKHYDNVYWVEGPEQLKWKREKDVGYSKDYHICSDIIRIKGKFVCTKERLEKNVLVNENLIEIRKHKK